MLSVMPSFPLFLLLFARFNLASPTSFYAGSSNLSFQALNNGWVSRTPEAPLRGGRACDCPAFGDVCFINGFGNNQDPDWQDKHSTAVSLQ